MEERPACVSNPEGYDLRYLVFSVPSVKETVHDLEGNGIASEPVHLDASTNKLMTFFLDPDGLPIEIYE